MDLTNKMVNDCQNSEAFVGHIMSDPRFAFSI